MPIAPLSSAQGKELHPPILNTLAMNVGQVKIDIPYSWFYSIWWYLKGDYTHQNYIWVSSAPQNILDKLRADILERGLIQPKIDPYLFIKYNTICIFHVDDTILAGT